MTSETRPLSQHTAPPTAPTVPLDPTVPTAPLAQAVPTARLPHTAPTVPLVKAGASATAPQYPAPVPSSGSTGEPPAAGSGDIPAPQAAQVERVRPPLRVPLTVLHLAAMGLVGFTTIGLLFGALGTGIGLVLVLGVGLVVLVGLVYAVFGVAWFETQRVSGLYDLQVSAPRWVAQHGSGFKAWLRSVLRQAGDGRMWRGVANFGVASVLGALTLALAQGFFRSLFTVFETFSVWWQPGLLGMLLSLAGIVGLALLHRVLSLAIIGAGANEEQLTEQVRASSAQREGAVRAADVERTRIERDLHDGVQPRLVSVGMTLGLAQQKIDTDPAAAKALVAEAHTSTKAAITELRQLARGIYASVLDDRGLDAALSALAARSHVPVQLDVRLPDRCSRDAEAAVYFAIAESLTNAAKHSRASGCRVTVRVRDGGVLWARVEDNGVGGARVLPGGGLDGITNRVLAAGGTSRLDSPQGGPTSLEVSVPCAS